MNKEDKKWALLCYIPVVNIVLCPLAAVRRANSKFCRFHARQGLVIFGILIFTILLGFVSQVLSLMMWGVTILLYIAGLAIVSEEKETRIPVVARIALMIPEFYVYKLLTGKDPGGLEEEDLAVKGPDEELGEKPNEIKKDDSVDNVSQESDQAEQSHQPDDENNQN